jgi:hypothetical protein
MPEVNPEHEPKEKPQAAYESPRVFELGDVEELTFGPGGDVADSKTIAHPQSPVPADDWPND